MQPAISWTRSVGKLKRTIEWRMPRLVADAMSEDHDRGRRDGLRLALSILAAEETKWETLLGQSPSWRTNVSREVRHKTLQVAQARIRTALNRLTPKTDATMDVELASALERAGL